MNAVSFEGNSFKNDSVLTTTQAFTHQLRT